MAFLFSNDTDVTEKVLSYKIIYRLTCHTSTYRRIKRDWGFSTLSRFSHIVGPLLNPLKSVESRAKTVKEFGDSSWRPQ